MERGRKVMHSGGITPSLRTFQGREKELVCALSHHREILRREIAFLRTEITSRGLATISGKKDYLKSRSEGKSASPHLVHGLSQLSGQGMDSGKFDLLEVSLPYLVNDEDEALGFLLHDLENLYYRIKSFATILKEFSVPITSEKVRLLHLMVRSFHNMWSTADQRSYEEYHTGWTSSWGSEIEKCGSFSDTTTLSPMQFTHCTPSTLPFGCAAGTALQIYSFKIVELKGDLNWPLHVYGVVAARDTVDRNRNLLFCRSRANCQELSQHDPFLRLTGPSRAILAENPVRFEVELKIKYGTNSQDIALLSSITNYHSNYHTAFFPSGVCTAELSLGKLAKAVQATIVSVSVVEGPWPFEYGARVACSLSATDFIDPSSRQVVLLDIHGEEMLDNYHLHLSRNVVSVELHGTLRVAIQAYTASRTVAQQSHVDFPAKYCQTSTDECFFGNSKVKITVAWSLLVKERLDLLVDGYLA